MSRQDFGPCGLVHCKKKDFAAQKSDGQDENNSSYQSIDPNMLSDQLKDRNEMLIKNIITLKRKRNEIVDCFNKYKEDNNDLETDIERLTYKIQLITKSLCQRLKARSLYEKTLKEIECKYAELVKHSGKLLHAMENEISNLADILEKRQSVEKKEIQRREKCDVDKYKLSCLSMKECTGKKDTGEPGVICCYDQEYPEKLNSRSQGSSQRDCTDSEKLTSNTGEDDYCEYDNNKG